MRVPSEFGIVFHSVAVGLGFVWLFGFAIGYPNPLVAWLIAGAGLGCLWLGFKIQKSSR